MKNKRGFTLIELMAVVVIISLIAILTFPNIINQINKSKDANKSNINSVVIAAAKKYVADNPSEFDGDNYSVPIETLIDTDYLKEDIIANNDNNLSTKYVFFDKGKIKISKLYEELNFIESTGTQWIDSGVNYSYNTKIELTVNALANEGVIFGLYREGHWTIGVRIRDNLYEGLWLYNNGDNVHGQSAVEFLTSNIEYNNKVTIVLDNTGMKINDTKISSSNSREFSEIDCGISIGTTIEINDLVTNNAMSNAHLKIYSFKFYKNNVLKRDFIPVLDHNNVACLYDKVEDKFYYNQGTGEFLYG